MVNKHPACAALRGMALYLFTFHFIHPLITQGCVFRSEIDCMMVGSVTSIQYINASGHQFAVSLVQPTDLTWKLRGGGAGRAWGLSPHFYKWGGLISKIAPPTLCPNIFCTALFVHMQALHRKLDVVLVRILPYNCSETDYSCCEDSPPSRTPPSTRMRVSPSDLFRPPPQFFRSAAHVEASTLLARSLQFCCDFPVAAV